MQMQEISCVICDSDSKLLDVYPSNFSEKDLNSTTFSARRQVDHVHYKLVRCLNCGLLFSNPILDTHIINELYSKSDITYHDEIKCIISDYLHYFNKYLLQNPTYKQNFSLLEIGCGNGFFLEAVLKKYNAKVYGLELSDKIIQNSSSNIKSNIFTSFEEINKETFDIICSFQTIDHMIDPLNSIHKAKNLLKNNGNLFLILHNEASLSHFVLKDKSPIIDIQHIFLFNKKTIVKLLKKAGFKDIVVFEIWNTYPLKYWFKLLPKKFQKLTFLFKFFENFKLKLPPGNMGVIARK